METQNPPRRLLPPDAGPDGKTPPAADLLDIITSIVKVESLDVLFNKVLATIARNFNIKYMTLGVLDEATGFYCVRAVYGYPPDLVQKMKQVAYTHERMTTDLRDEFKIGRNCYWVRYEDKSMAYDDDFLYVLDPERLEQARKSEDEWHELDYIDFVMTDKDGRWTGWLEINEPRDGKVPSRETIERIQILADLVAVAIENSKMYQEAVDRMSEARSYVDLITHEMGNLVRPLEHLAKELRGTRGLDQKVVEISENMLVTTRSMSSLIDTIRKYSEARSTSGLQLKPYDLRDVIKQAGDVAKRESPSKEMIVNFTRPPDKCMVMADEMVHDLFQNVMQDAARRTNTPRVVMDVSIKEEHDVYTVTLGDKGTPIPGEVLNRVFSDQGLGANALRLSDVGLSMIALLVNRYDGIVSVKDRHPGAKPLGMNFEISLPKAR